MVNKDRPKPSTLVITRQQTTERRWPYPRATGLRSWFCGSGSRTDHGRRPDYDARRGLGGKAEGLGGLKNWPQLRL